MQNLPSAEVYAQEANFMPWGDLLQSVLRHAYDNIPQDGTVVDMMCGTGFLLGMLKQLRPDIKATGVDLGAEYIEFARDSNPDIEFVEADALTWRDGRLFDAVLCTGGLHHIHWDKQDEFIGRLGLLMKEGAFVIVADPYIAPYETELERRLCAAHLGHEYLIATMKKGAPDNVVAATAQLIINDVLGVEFKTSIKRVDPFFVKHFTSAERHHTWPKESCSYGDFYYLCTNN